MSKEYPVLLDPALEIDVERLSKAWAEIPECSEVGEIVAGTPARARSSYNFDPASAVLGALIVTGVALAKDLVLLLVKRALDRADAAKSSEVEVTTETDAATGLPIVRVSRRRR